MSELQNDKDQFFENQNEKKKYKKLKRYAYKLYIPENLDIEEILNQDKPRFRYYRDCFIYLLHLIVSIPARLKNYDIENHKAFTSIDKRILSKRIHNYREYIEFLKEHIIIEEGTSYKPLYYARGLKYTESYRTKVRGIYITKNTLIKSITERANNRDLQAEYNLWFLKQWFNEKLTIDMNKAIEYLEKDAESTRKKLQFKRLQNPDKSYKVSIDEIVNMGYVMKYIVADKINEGKNHNLIVDKTSGRFHSPLTQLKKELRKFVRYDGEQLCGIDIVNSQPLLALIIVDFRVFMRNRVYELIGKYNDLFNITYTNILHNLYSNSTSTMFVNLLQSVENIPDVINFKEAVIKGKFYESFANLLKAKHLISDEILSLSDEEEQFLECRKFAKEAIFTSFFSKENDVRWNKPIQAFKSCYPTVFKLFSLLKINPRNNKGRHFSRHNSLACILQRFESNLILNVVCTEIHAKHPEIPIFTIHDSIVTTKNNVAIVEEIFREGLLNKLGVEPQLKVDEWY